MTMETTLQALIVNRCPRVYQTVAPAGSVPDRPYVVWQQIGGKSLRDVTNTALDKRNALMQVAVWADSSKAARDLIQQLEEDLCTAAGLTAEPMGEHLAQFDEDTKYFGAVQRFSIYAPRT